MGVLIYSLLFYYGMVGGWEGVGGLLSPFRNRRERGGRFGGEEMRSLKGWLRMLLY